jgi:hypothetical protein
MLTRDMKAIPDLFGDVAHQLGHLIGTEVRLAAAETAEKVAEAGKGAAYLAIAGMVIMPGIVMLLLALAAWLNQMGIAPAPSYLAAAGVGVGLGMLFLFSGLKRLKPKNLKLTKTTQQLDKDVAAAKEIVG